MCKLDLYMRAHAHWPNVAQNDFTVVFVIEVVVVAEIVNELLRLLLF